jgi:predicted DNA-binding transcriptional regulator
VPDYGLVNKTKRLIRKMPVSIDPKDQAVWDYVVGRKRPVTIRQAMKVLLISETHARRALDYFVLKGLADMSKQGGVRFYKVKE